MKITFQFNSKSRGQNIPEALAIAERCGGIIENKFYKINFASPEDENFEKLFNLVGDLKGSSVHIDDGDPINARKFFYAVNCQNKLLCKGVCNHVQFGYFSLEQFDLNYGDYIENGVLMVGDERMIQYLTDFLEPIDERRFKINKDSFLNYFIKETEMEAQFCSKFNLDIVKSEIEKLPNEIQLISREEYIERYEPEKFDIDNFIKTILMNCEIDSKFSLEDILNCSKALTLLTGPSRENRIENSNVLVYSFPNIDKHVLLKINLFEEGDVSEREEEEGEEIKDIITKENDLFCVKTSFYELYFQLFEKMSTKAEEAFNILKKI
ncbi:MAG: hypothetical protein ACFFDN_45755 [Candidatus Hodarchaeota archaeon]